MAKILSVDEICQISDRVKFANEVEKFYKREKKNKVLSETEIAEKLSYILINHIVEDNNWIVLIYLEDLLKIVKISGEIKKDLEKKLLELLEDYENGNECYFALKCYAYLMKKNSYEKLLSIIFENKPLILRALSIKLLSNLSKQPFDFNLPSDVAYWNESDLKLEDIKSWKENGMQDGEGYKPPIQDDAIINPTTKIEKAVCKFQKKISKYRSNEPSIQNQYLVISDKNKLDKVIEKYPIKGTYYEFLSRFSPQDVSFYKAGNQYTLYGVDDILEFQVGYSVDENGNKFEDWNENLLVIADSNSDPYCIDLSEEDSSIYFSYHGMGEWEFEKVYDSLVEFLNFLAK